MSIYNGPPRPGARGGKDQFSWENVRSDKDREFYLGHSVKALTGRWQKGKDVYWYTRDKNEQDVTLQEELRAVKAREEEVMLEVLGLKPKSVKPVAPPTLNSSELAQLLKRRGSEGEEGGAAPMGLPGAEADGDKGQGLGFSAQKAMGAIAKSDSLTMELGATMAGVGIPAGSRGQSGPGPAAAQQPQGALPGPPPLTASAGLLAMVRAGAKLSSEQLKALGDADRKAVKKARKEVKKEKKAAKKAAKKASKRKHREKQARSSDSSSGSSSGSESDGQRVKKTAAVPGDRGRSAFAEQEQLGGRCAEWRRDEGEDLAGRARQRRHDSPEQGRRAGGDRPGRDYDGRREGAEVRHERGSHMARDRAEGSRRGQEQHEGGRRPGRGEERAGRRGQDDGTEEREEGRWRGREEREERREDRGREESRGKERSARREEDREERAAKRGRRDDRSPARSSSPRPRRHDTP